MRIHKNTLYLGVMLILIVGAGAMLVNGDISITGNVVNVGGEVQVVKLSVSGGNYVLEPSELRKGVTVRLEAAEELPGCSRAVVIPEFDVSKTFTKKGDYVEFVPDKSGEFVIACSMYMYTGKFSVLEDDGSKSDYVEPVKESAGSCGSGGEGCGCGG